MKKWMVNIFLQVVCSGVFAQARLILNNGGIVNITNNAFVVIDNPNPNAITRNTSGHIISEGQLNRIKWNIGTTVGSYVVPFGIGTSTYLPVSLSTSGASGAGSLIFAMYPVGSWLNSSNLPAGVTNFINNYGTDNSAFAIDRFWRVEPSGYTTKPDLSNFILTYLDIEHSVANNSIIEADLIAQRYNDTQNAWDDYMPATVTNTVANTATVASLPSVELYTWWTLVDNRFVLPIELTTFNGNCNGDSVKINWSTAQEKNNNYFVVERSEDDIHFSFLQQVPSKDPNSQHPQDYSIYDHHPLNGKTYYRLKQVDMDGKYTYSSVIVVKCNTGDISMPMVSIYPNPAENNITVDVKGLPGKKSCVIYDVTGRKMMDKEIISPDENVKEIIDISLFAKATYILRIDSNNELFEVIRFVKK